MVRTSLPPGFRFHPTDVELVLYYLKRKVMGKKLHYEAIAEVNIYKFSPWDLPGLLFLFFCSASFISSGHLLAINCLVSLCSIAYHFDTHTYIQSFRKNIVVPKCGITSNLPLLFS